MEQQVWSVQLAKQSTLRPRVAAPAKAGGFVRTKYRILTAASYGTHVSTTTTLRRKGSIRAPEHLDSRH